jgi:hypothetical protein
MTRISRACKRLRIAQSWRIPIVTIPHDDITVSADDVSSFADEPPPSPAEEVDRSDVDWLNNVY